jgi:hypothetical protein
MTKKKSARPEEATSVNTEVVQDLPGELALANAIPEIALEAHRVVDNGAIAANAIVQVLNGMFSIYQVIKKL